MLISFEKQRRFPWFFHMLPCAQTIQPFEFHEKILEEDLAKWDGVETRWFVKNIIEKTQLKTPKELWCYIFLCLTWLTPLHNNKSTLKTSGWKKVLFRWVVFFRPKKSCFGRQKFDLGSWRMWAFNVSWWSWKLWKIPTGEGEGGDPRWMGRKTCSKKQQNSGGFKAGAKKEFFGLEVKMFFDGTLSQFGVSHVFCWKFTNPGWGRRACGLLCHFLICRLRLASGEWRS